VSTPSVLGAVLLLTVSAQAGEVYRADFSKPLDSSWKWIREMPSAWRLTNGALEVRTLPGNMWGPANDAKNVLTRPAPDPSKGKIEVLATVENRPTEQYEQADLVWYYADGHMVKVGHEMVDGKISVVMGREENDRTRTMSINPVAATTVTLRFLVSSNRLNGFFRVRGERQWQAAGECSLPVLSNTPPKIALQFYQGPANIEHWARVSEFRINQE
jgi:regulation of enolase protein 1 (concanavalin A-like superfamily)